MSGHPESDHPHDDDGYDHGSYRSYLIGFLISVTLTAIPFAVVMTGVLSTPLAVTVVVACALVQIVVQMIYFLHLNPRSEGGWNLLALLFTLIVLGIVISGSLWVMHHLNTNMMPAHNMEAML